jgi:uncharacterized protein YcaQ
MMMRMIDEGGIPALIDHVRAADEDNPKGYYEFEPVKQTKKDSSWVADAVGKVVKMVYLLLYDLPEGFRYRVVFTRRNLSEVLESQDIMLQRRGKSQGEVSHEQLVEHFRGQIEKIEGWLADQPHFEVVYIDYNELMKDPGPSVDRMNDFLGGELDTDAMRAVIDPDLYRRRK